MAAERLPGGAICKRQRSVNLSGTGIQVRLLDEGA